MSEFKGTKGTWKRVKLIATNYYIERNEIQFGSDGECVAEFVQNDYDALLISKAPEMLDMLENIQDFLCSYPSQSEMDFEATKVRQLIKEATEI